MENLSREKFVSPLKRIPRGKRYKEKTTKARHKKKEVSAVKL